MDRDTLIAGGFVPTRYEGQEGEYLTKRVRVEQMPYAAEHLVDDAYIFGTSEAVTELRPDGKVQLHIPDTDYVEGPEPAESEQGQALLADALAAK